MGGMKMKKIIVGLIVVVMIVIIVWLRLNPPLENGSFYRNPDSTTVVIDLGNKGFGDIQVTEVFVNNGETPSDVKMQIFHPDKGSIVVNDVFSSEAAAHNLFSLKDAKIKKGTIIREIYERQGKNQLKEEDRIYGLTIVNKQPIYNFEVHYSYLKMPYKTEISTK